MALLEAGAGAPAFTLSDHDGNDVSLADYSGKWLIIWWYPKADTPG